MKDTLVLIDGHAILHRAYHALPPLTTRSGEPVNAVYGFALMLLKILEELKPDCLAASFDTSKSEFRTQEFVGYKAQRPSMEADLVSQQPKVYEMMKAFNVPVYLVPGYEADDIIGTLARQGADQGLTVLIVTGDKDFMQIVSDDRIKLYMPTKGLSEVQIVGEREVEEKMGLPPEKIVDYKALVGDNADNYPGVPGIGPKTATELLSRYDSLEKIYEGFEGIEGFGETIKNKLREGKESAFLSKKLATIMTDAPITLNLADCVSTDYDKEKVIKFFNELGFRSLIKRVGGFEGNEGYGGNKGEKKDNGQQNLF